MTTNTDLHGAMPELPNPTYIYHTSEEEGGDDLFEFSRSGAVDIDEHYDGGVCADCVRLYTADQTREYARAAIQQAAVPKPRRVTIADARDYLNTNDKAFWVTGWNECVEEMLAANPAPPKQQPALGRGDGGGVPLTLAQIDLAVRNAQIAYALDKFTSFEVALARKVEAAHGIGAAPTGQINPDSAGQGMFAIRVADQTKEGPA